MLGENFGLFDEFVDVDTLQVGALNDCIDDVEKVISGGGYQAKPEHVIEAYHRYPELVRAISRVPATSYWATTIFSNEHEQFLFALKYDCVLFVEHLIEKENFDLFSCEDFIQWVLYLVYREQAENCFNYFKEKFTYHFYFEHGLGYLKEIIDIECSEINDIVVTNTSRALRVLYLYSTRFLNIQDEFNELLGQCMRRLHDSEEPEVFEEELTYLENNYFLDADLDMQFLMDFMSVLVKYGANPFVDTEFYQSMFYYTGRKRPITRQFAVETIVDYLNGTVGEEKPLGAEQAFYYDSAGLLYPGYASYFGQHLPHTRRRSPALLETRHEHPNQTESEPSSTPDSEQGKMYPSFMLQENYSAPIKSENRMFNLKRTDVNPNKQAVYVTDERLSQIELLAENFPNFAEVVEDIATHLSLSLVTQRPLKIEPLLLIGPPGIGKTEFTNELCKMLGIEKVFANVANMSANFTMAGTDPTWSGAQPGVIADKLINGNHINFILYLDEIDKSPESLRGGGDPLSVLYDLMEPTAAAQFQDQYYRNQAKFDASHVSLIASGNSVENINTAIQSRFTLFEIEPPTPKQKKLITQSIYQRMVKEYRLTALLSEQLPNLVVEFLQDFEPRQIRQAIKYGLAKTVRQEASEMRVEFISQSLIRQFNKHKPNTMGFVE